MLRKILTGFFMLVLVSAAATPEIILPKTKIIMPLSWYADQARQWKDETVAHGQSAMGWINYYAALRYSQTAVEDLNAVLVQMAVAIPGTTELKIAQAWNEGYGDHAFALMKEAYAANPDASMTYGALTMFHELAGDMAGRRQFSKKLLMSGAVAQSLLSYSYNVLMSVADHAVLFTEGDNGTLPLFILQDVMNVRNDVTILNLDLLSESGYRNKKLAQSGLLFLNEYQDNVTASVKKSLCSALPQQNPDSKFYYALSIGRENILTIRDQLYVVGLTSQISKERLDNLSLIKENIEQKFLLDYLQVDLNGESEFSAGRMLSSNYLVPMLMLDDYYLRSGDQGKLASLRRLLLRVARETGKEQMVMNFLNGRESEKIPFVASVIDVDHVDKTMRIIRGSVYAQNHEVTNEEFNLFLDYLRKNNFDELYQKYKFDLSAYSEPALSMMLNYSKPSRPFKKERFFMDYPAVNMSYESALAYCDWLTDQYNNQTNKKFKKVKFRLPAISEWQIAALGDPAFQSWVLDENTVLVNSPLDSMSELGKGKRIRVGVKDISYPWWSAHNYRNKAQNHRNCWLGNFKVPENCKPCAIAKYGGDGYITMAKVSQYFPNNIGLYDVVGNVAEMTIEKGKACGGSWNHAPEVSTIRSINTYAAPDAAVGFRIFMEVTEQ